MKPLTFIGVPIDSVSPGGGNERGPRALRELGPPAALGASLACYNPDEDPHGDCGVALVEVLANSVLA